MSASRKYVWSRNIFSGVSSQGDVLKPCCFTETPVDGSNVFATQAAVYKEEEEERSPRKLPSCVVWLTLATSISIKSIKTLRFQKPALHKGKFMFEHKFLGRKSVKSDVCQWL